MGLLNYITATSLDEDYAHVSRSGAAVRGTAAGRTSGRAPSRWWCSPCSACWSPPPAVQTVAQRRRVGQLPRVARRRR